MTDNQLTFIGRLGRDPELRFTGQGAAVVSFDVVWNDRKRNAAGEWEQGDATYLRCTAWRDLAEQIAEMHKGDRIIVVGRIQQRSFETREGEKRAVIECQVEDAGRSLRWKPRDQRPAGTSDPADDPVPF